MPPIRSSGPKSRKSPTGNPTICTICGASIKYSQDLGRHNLTHAPNPEELKTRCPVPLCGFRSLQSSNVRTHALNVHKLEVHPCAHLERKVSKSETNADASENRIKVADSDSRSRCTFCTVDWDELQRHRQTVHGLPIKQRQIVHSLPIKQPQSPYQAYISQTIKLPELLPEHQSSVTIDGPVVEGSRCATSTEAAHPTTFKATYEPGEYSSTNNASSFRAHRGRPRGPGQVLNDSFSVKPMAYNSFYLQSQIEIEQDVVQFSVTWGRNAQTHPSLPIPVHTPTDPLFSSPGELFYSQGQEQQSAPPMARSQLNRNPVSHTYPSPLYSSHSLSDGLVSDPHDDSADILIGLGRLRAAALSIDLRRTGRA